MNIRDIRAPQATAAVELPTSDTTYEPPKLRTLGLLRELTALNLSASDVVAGNPGRRHHHRCHGFFSCLFD
jgi:hypothetical protein